MRTPRLGRQPCRLGLALEPVSAVAIIATHTLVPQVNEVAEIFQDLALLVNEQGTQIDNIQTNIEAAAASTTRGVRELTYADRTQQRRRSRICCLAIIIVVMLIMLLTVLHALPGVKM